MTSRLPLLLLPLLGLGALVAVAPAPGQAPLVTGDVAETRAALEQARKEERRARLRAERLEANARRVNAVAERTARQSAAVAARIQETEAEIASREAQIALITAQRDRLRDRLAARQVPLVRLTAALQRLSRRPPVLALLRPGSVHDAMHMRALLDTMLPEVERRTADVRAEIARGKALERQAALATRDLRASHTELAERRKRLVAVETQQRLASREASGIASREADRALALGEKARDLTALVDEVARQGELRAELARLPGPVLRPDQPAGTEAIPAQTFAEADNSLPDYILPVAGRVVAGFGEELEGRRASKGIVLAARAGAQAVAPAAGRVAFAGPYRGFGRIVIIEHDGGWTTLVTGLARLDARVGEELVEGSPLGLTGPDNPIVTVELRRDGEPVNPLQYMDSL